MSLVPPRVMSEIHVQAADGSTASFVIDVAPEAVQAEWDRIGAPKTHGMMFLKDRRDEHHNWTIYTSSVTGWSATDSQDPIPVHG